MCVWEYEHKPYQSLPKIHTIINFHGELVGVEDGITIVAVHNCSYFHSPNDAVDKEQF
jgi:hypothetical protein